MNVFVTNFDILQVFPNCKIIKYANLDNYMTIYDLLPNKMDFVFILTESELNSGHWTLLIRDGNLFEYFDSYGESPKTILQYIPSYKNKQLGNMYKEDLGNIIKSVKPGDKFIYNKFQFQSDKPDINTCGRWCICRVALFLSDSVDLKQFTKIIKLKSKDLKKSFDELIVFLVNI